MTKILLAALIIAFTFGCSNSKKKEAVQPLDTSDLLHQVTVTEVIQTDAYTYLKVRENERDFWMAVNKQDVSEGDKLYYDAALEMTDFRSKELNRTFDKIYFVQKISPKPIKQENEPVSTEQKPQGKVIEEFNPEIYVEPVEGAISIADLYAGKEDYVGKTVKVTGQVVKVNNNIMSRNWIHLQDGSRHEKYYDLTVTSDQTAKVGDKITVEGKISLNKDFGAGYFYDLIMENGSLK